jgi:hypothetical protein
VGEPSGKRLRNEIISIFIEATLHCLRVENVVIHVAVECATEAAQDLADNGAAGLEAMPQVNPPFLIPDAVQRMAGGGREGGRNIRCTESPETILFLSAHVRVPRVPRRPKRAEQQESHEISLEKHVDVGERAEPATVMEIAKLRIELERRSGIDAILDLLVSRRVGHVIDVRQEGDHLLVKRLRPQVGGLEMELGKVRRERVARIGPAEKEIRRDITRLISGAQVGRHA